MKSPQINDKKLLNQQTINIRKNIVCQQGAALIIFMLVLMLSAVTYFVGGLDANSVALDREKQTQAALAEAKAALIGDVLKTIDLDVFYKDPVTKGNNQPVTLSNPDESDSSSKEGDEIPSYGSTDFTIIGRFPWKSLNTNPLKDGWGECLWYVVSGRFKHSPDTSILNWDTQGQIDVIDEKGNPVVSNLVALIIAPGPPLAGQDRSPDKTNSPQCGGNYEPKNYLDTPSMNNAILGQVNYFDTSSDTTKAPNSNNKTFVMAKNAYYNDRFAFITVDDIFNRVMQRSDFADNINNLLKMFSDKKVSATAGNSICAGSFFCKNWIGMVFVKDDPSATVTINLASQNVGNQNTQNKVPCTRVIIFGGKRDAIGKYLDAQNEKSFNGLSHDYIGNQFFDPKNPTQDVIQCVP